MQTQEHSNQRACWTARPLPPRAHDGDDYDEWETSTMALLSETEDNNQVLLLQQQEDNNPMNSSSSTMGMLLSSSSSDSQWSDFFPSDEEVLLSNLDDDDDDKGSLLRHSFLPMIHDDEICRRANNAQVEEDHDHVSLGNNHNVTIWSNKANHAQENDPHGENNDCDSSMSSLLSFSETIGDFPLDALNEGDEDDDDCMLEKEEKEAAGAKDKKDDIFVIGNHVDQQQDNKSATLLVNNNNQNQIASSKLFHRTCQLARQTQTQTNMSCCGLFLQKQKFFVSFKTQTDHPNFIMRMTMTRLPEPAGSSSSSRTETKRRRSIVHAVALKFGFNLHRMQVWKCVSNPMIRIVTSSNNHNHDSTTTKTKTSTTMTTTRTRMIPRLLLLPLLGRKKPFRNDNGETTTTTSHTRRNGSTALPSIRTK